MSKFTSVRLGRSKREDENSITHTSVRMQQTRCFPKRKAARLGLAVLALALPALVPNTGTNAFLQPYQGVSLSTKQSSLPDTCSPLLALTQEQQQFELQVGKALDTLRSDYPTILHESPDFSIYSKEVEVIDPSGVKVHGLKAYRNTFGVLHALVKFLYCPERSNMNFRMCFDKARQNIRIHWNAQVVPRAIFGGSRTTLHVDGISVYELDRRSGNITQHRIEQLLINNMPVMPKEGVFVRLKQQTLATGVPNYYLEDVQLDVLPFRAPAPLTSPSSSLFAMEASGDSRSSPSDDDFDWEAFENKNKSRKKFGLKPISVDEFKELQVQVQQLDAEQRQRAASAAELAKQQKEKEDRNLFGKLFGNVLKDTCESNFDCERPEVCCDFGFKKMCCSSGNFVGQDSLEGKPAMVPVPVDVTYPPGQGPNDGFPPRY